MIFYNFFGTLTWDSKMLYFEKILFSSATIKIVIKIYKNIQKICWINVCKINISPSVQNRYFFYIFRAIGSGFQGLLIFLPHQPSCYIHCSIIQFHVLATSSSGPLRKFCVVLISSVCHSVHLSHNFKIKNKKILKFKPATFNILKSCLAWNSTFLIF